MSSRALIDAFLSRKRFAMVGVSRNGKDFSRMLFRAFSDHGYDPVPVNPAATEIDGRLCFRRVQDVPGAAAALLMTPPRLTESAVRDCAQAGVEIVWMYRAVGQGAVSPAAVRFCESNGIQVIAGHCPFMFLDGSGFPHNLHAVLLKWVGRYPA